MQWPLRPLQQSLRPHESVHPWNGTVPSSVDKMPFMLRCAHPDSEASDPRKLTGSNGLACFFFNNSSDISHGRSDRPQR